ncbi:hypothetical protein Pcac1_g17314 [Phytophthora cactorum]|uniref:Uncharacterized protein n=2 Tax=Phytophthora cactorum TaxID=29920 RepID=A0A8T1C1Y9_9STRA|nr:hypothetical protein Pcac1_g17314 [Phytophthora cactorum]KAG2913303.1 hypothetical protein PC115_g12126 [Phytophthora cactorum]KAG2977435.1 hypothetical protein PC118_g12881 [Phytophthora cactorum]
MASELMSACREAQQNLFQLHDADATHKPLHDGRLHDAFEENMLFCSVFTLMVLSCRCFARKRHPSRTRPGLLQVAGWIETRPRRW